MESNISAVYSYDWRLIKVILCELLVLDRILSDFRYCNHTGFWRTRQERCTPYCGDILPIFSIRLI